MRKKLEGWKRLTIYIVKSSKWGQIDVEEGGANCVRSDQGRKSDPTQ